MLNKLLRTVKPPSSTNFFWAVGNRLTRQERAYRELERTEGVLSNARIRSNIPIAPDSRAAICTATLLCAAEPSNLAEPERTPDDVEFNEGRTMLARLNRNKKQADYKHMIFDKFHQETIQ